MTKRRVTRQIQNYAVFRDAEGYKKWVIGLALHHSASDFSAIVGELASVRMPNGETYEITDVSIGMFGVELARIDRAKESARRVLERAIVVTVERPVAKRVRKDPAFQRFMSRLLPGGDAAH